MRRAIGVLLLLAIVAVGLFVGYRLYVDGPGDPLADQAEVLVKAFLSGELVNEPDAYADMATDRLLADMAAIKEAQARWEKERGVRFTMSFVRFVRRPVLLVTFPPDGDATWKRYVAVVVYRTAAGTFMGQVDVDFVKVRDAWKADHIRGVIPLAQVRDGNWVRLEEQK